MPSRARRIGRTGGLPLPALLAALAAAATPGVARADVIEIGADGAVSTRSGAGAVDWQAADAGDDTVPKVPADAITMADVPTTAPATLSAALNASASRNGVSPTLLAALVGRESRWRANAVSPKGAIGLAQLMPATARMLAVDPRDPVAGIEGGARYLRMMLDRFGGDVERSLAAYNAGPGRVLRAGGIPAIAETRAYVAAILDRLTPATVTAKGLIR